MLVTSKGRYALRLMIYVARAGEGEKVALRLVAQAENISLKYLEQLAHTMVQAGLLKSIRGHGGGYMLARPASEITAGDVLRAADGPSTTVACDGLNGGCERVDECSTIQFWKGLDGVIEQYVDGFTLEDLVKQDRSGRDATQHMLASLAKL